MKFTKTFYWIIVCCSLFLILQFYYKYHFFYIEQLQLFLFSGQYASDTIPSIGGIALYVAQFLVQFYFLPVAGPLINAILLTLIGVLTQKVLDKITPLLITYLLSLLPVCALLLLLPDINCKLQGTIAYLCMLLALQLYRGIVSPFKRIVSGMMLATLLFWIAGPVASLFAVTAFLCDVLLKKPKPILSVLYLFVVGFLGLTAVFAGWQGAYRMVFLPDAYFEPLLHARKIYLSWIALPVCLVIVYICKNKKAIAWSRKKERLFISLQLLPLFLFLGWMVRNDRGPFQRNMEQDYYLRTEQWDKIIATFPGEEKGNLQTMNVLNLALAQKGELGNRLFHYRQAGSQTLLADWDSSLPMAISLCDIYYHIGDIAVAQKLAFEGIVASLNEGSPRLLIRLVETNLIFGAYPVAEKYISLLGQTAFYKKEAAHYRTFLYNDHAVEQDLELGGKRKGLIKDGQYAVSNYTPATIEQLANHYPANPLPIQYLLAICLTNKDLKSFRTLLEKYHRTEILPVLSKSHQEAVIALEQKNPAFWIKNGVNTTTEQRFRAFDYDMGNRNVPNYKENIASTYGHTFWYYILSTNNKPKTINETNHPYGADNQPHLLQFGGGDKPPHNECITAIFPDYTDVTIPVNIAPLNFSLTSGEKATATFNCSTQSFQIASDAWGAFTIPAGKWKKLLEAARGGQVEVHVTTQKDNRAYTSFRLFVAEEPVDPYIAYRLIEPGYALWNKMGIYQRDLETYNESAVYENKMTDYNCVNCHSFCAQNPDKMVFHLRAKHGGTVLTDGDAIDFLQTNTDQTISALVYPSWHPSGKFITFSVNKTTQDFHPSQRVEVFDLASDVVVYDVEKQIILSTPPIFSKSDFETFPTFSADGKTLYFCSGPACQMPDSIQNLRYSLCSIAFDPETKSFGTIIDTIYNAETHRKSVSFPRVSPDGRYLMCTLSSYGTFPIWHKDADLYLLDLQTKESRPLDHVNSNESDSYHAWSSNSRWVVFSSRRLDGLYTRPFFVYINENGEAAKPFLLPQKHATRFYTERTKSYNIPEFVTGKIKNRNYPVMKKAKDKSTHQQVKFNMVK